MKSLPHEYLINATAATDGPLLCSADGLPSLDVEPPKQFGGAGNCWSPEDLLVASVANCFILTFRSIARSSGFHWRRLTCSTSGLLEKTVGGLAFTRFVNQVALTLAEAQDEEKARELLLRAEKACLITNSLSGPVAMEIVIHRSDQ